MPHSDRFKINFTEPSAPSARDILTPLFRRKWLVLSTFSATLTASILVATLWAANYYAASMQVLVQTLRPEPAITSIPSASGAPKSISTDQVNSEIALLRGNDVLRSVTVACGLADIPSFTDILLPNGPGQRRAAKIEKTAFALGNTLNVKAEKISDVITVEYGRTGDPRVPPCVLNVLGKLYMEKHLHLARPAGTTDLFAQEADRYRRELQIAETKLANFGREAGMAAPDVLRGAIADNLASSMASLNQAREATAAEQARLQNLASQLNASPETSLMSETSLSASRLLQELQLRLLQAKNKRSELLVKFDAAYPLVREVDEEIADTTAAFEKAEQVRYHDTAQGRDPAYEARKQDLAKTTADIAYHKAQIQALDSSIARQQKQLADLDTKAIQQSQLVREVKLNESSYLLYSNKREQERTSDVLDKRRIVNVAIAVPPSVPVLPAHSPMLIITIGLLSSILLAVGAAFLAEYLDSSFRDPAEVTKTLEIPVLAWVPKQAVSNGISRN